MVPTPKMVREALRDRMIDPELGVNVIDLGLVYDIKVIPHTNLTSRRPPTATQLLAGRSRRAMVRGSGVSTDPPAGGSGFVRILMTLTSPGCPLAAVFYPMIRQALEGLPGLDPYKDVQVELTFDPPWHQGMMSERAKAELGFG